MLSGAFNMRKHNLIEPYMVEKIERLDQRKENEEHKNTNKNDRH